MIGSETRDVDCGRLKSALYTTERQTEGTEEISGCCCPALF